MPPYVNWHNIDEKYFVSSNFNDVEKVSGFLNLHGKTVVINIVCALAAKYDYVH